MRINHNHSAIDLIKTQKRQWPLMAKNYADLSHVKVRRFDFEAFKILIQFNPARIISSSAKVDKKSIEKRPCFLCASNRPVEQREISFEPDYLILVNPFPIFPLHLTISHKKHTIQEIKPYFRDMLSLSKALTDFTLFYNGPHCGASAPDHFHFQAGNKGFMSLDSEISVLMEKYGTLLQRKKYLISRVNDGFRKFFVMESSDEHLLESGFNTIYKQLKEKMNTKEEPDMNIHTSYDGTNFRVILFPRGAHRPWQYFDEGDKNILLSPASVDLGGVLITPLEKDFNKITRNDIIDILKQVSISEEIFLSVKL